MTTDVRASSRRSSRGFSLIELIVVVAIVGILAGIAYPSYRNQVIKSNRSAAKAYIMSLASREEQLLLDRRQYLGAANNAALGSTLGLMAVPAEVAQLYNFSVVVDNAASPPNFTISAAPVAGTMQATDPTLTLNSLGVKTPASYW